MDRIIRKKRNKFELLADLLESATGGAKKTTIMFRSNLSFHLLNKYMAFLMENGFLERKDSRYFPTKKGLAYLNRYSQYRLLKSDLIMSQEEILSIMPVKGGRGKGK